MKEWMSDGFRRPPAQEDNPSMCMYDMAPDDWNLFCELCGYSASEVASMDEATVVANRHLRDAHGWDVDAEADRGR